MRMRVRAALLLLVCGLVFFECLLWLRVGASELQLVLYPTVGLTPEGRLRYWKVSSGEDDKGSYLVEQTLDAGRNVIATRKMRVGDRTSPGEALYARVGWGDFYAPWGDMDPWFLRMRGIDTGWPEPRLAPKLNSAEARRRNVREAPVEWREEEGRLLCLERASDKLLAGFGPDGYRRGEKAREGARFTYTAVDSRWNRGTFLVYVEDEEERLVAVASKEPGVLPASSLQPLELVISRPPKGSWPVGNNAERAIFELGNELLFLNQRSEVLARTAFEPDVELSVEPHLWRGVYGLVSWLGPVRPNLARVRLRLFRDGGGVATETVDLKPVAFGERTVYALSGLIALLRPLPLCVASSLSEPETSRFSMNRWWWRDPFFAGGSRLWLLLSLAVSALCAWRALRQSRLRCGDTPFWPVAAFLLGPVGLLWMRLVVPRLPVEAVAGRKLAVNCELTEWPEPTRLGTEAFG